MVYLLAIQGMFYSNNKFYNDLQIVVKEVSSPSYLIPPFLTSFSFSNFAQFPRKTFVYSYI